MADRKITAFDAVAAANTAGDDVLPLVDISETTADNKNKKITLDNLNKCVSDGTAAAPSVAFRDDQDTGIFSPSNNNLAATTGGSERLRVDSQGRLLVNQTSLSSIDNAAKLQVNGSAVINNIRLHRTSVGNGIDNFGLGESVLTSTNMTSSCHSNIGIGKDVLAAPIGAQHNVAIGNGALEDSTSGIQNVAVGNFALVNATSGSQSTAVGYSALFRATTADNNVGIGNLAGYEATGEDNIFVGNSAGVYASTGSKNVFIGNSSGGAGNFALGGYAENTAVGHQALHSLGGTNKHNVAVGYQAGLQISGEANTCIGADAGEDITSGSGNIVIGDRTAADVSSPVHTITTADNRVVMGSTAVTNAYIQVSWTTVSDERDKVNFAPVPHGIEFVKQLNPVAFQFRESRESDVAVGPVRYGFKAQEVIALEGDSNVIIDDEDPSRLKYQGESLVPVLVNAMKEQQQQIEALQARLNALEAG